MQDYINELNRRKREELARVMTHREPQPLPQGAKTFLDYVSNPRKIGGLLADFTPVVGGIKGTLEEASA